MVELITNEVREEPFLYFIIVYYTFYKKIQRITVILVIEYYIVI